MRLILALAGALLVTTVNAEPFKTAPAVGTMYLFSTTTTGGTGSQEFKVVSPPPNGYYMVSFIANFLAAGTASAPVAFQCLLARDGSDVSQSTAESVTTGHFAIGLNGQGPIRIVNGTKVEVVCGTSDGSAWKFAALPLQVTFTRMEGEVKGGSLKDTGSPDVEGTPSQR